MDITSPGITKLPEDKGAVAGDSANDAKESVTQFVDSIKNTGSQLGTIASDTMSDLKADLDKLVARSSSMAGEELAAAKEQLLQKMSLARQSVDEAASGVTASLKQGVGAASDYVKESPLKTVAITAGVGILIGMLIGRH
ncbi:DUF883 family protein [Undibacterium sp. TJN25]|uniref:DUF883 family protein n=1 Tax=Undibacterium sp. TJN25 TaxID=3413056 RepID=UPI003BF43BC9